MEKQDMVDDTIWRISNVSMDRQIA